MQGRLKQLLVAVTSLLVMFLLGTNLAARADDGLVDVMTPKANFIANPVINENQAQILQGPNYNYQSFQWRLNSVRANGVKNNRLSEKTNKIEITLYGGMNSFDSQFRTLYNFQSANYVVVSGDKIETEKVWASTVLWASSTNFKLWGLNKKGVTRTITVDLTHLKDKFPLKVGFQFVGKSLSTGQLVKFSYYLGQFVASGISLKPTIDETLTVDSTVIRGSGIPGDQIVSSVDANRKVLVNSSGKYEINLSAPLKDYLNKNDSVTVTEANENGDSGTAVQKKLSIAAVAQSPEFDLEDDESLDLTNVNQLVKMLKLDGGEAVDAKFYYDISQDELNERITALKAGKSIVLPIYATKPGYIRSNIVNVRASNHSDALAFGQTTTKLEFGGVKKVPLVTTDYFPATPWEIIVHDHRKNKRAWKVTAKAQAGDQGKVDLTDYLWYKDGINQTCLKNHESVLVYQKATGADSADTTISFRSAGQGKQELPNQRSIFVQAGPKMKAGQYQAKILWSLIDAP